MKNYLLGLVSAVLLFSAYQATAKLGSPPKPKLEMTVESSLPFDQTIEALKMAGAAEKYGTQGVHKLSEILASKGFPRERLTILEVCNPKSATDALNNDVMAGLMMPCPIMVWQKGDKVMVTTMDTRIMSQMYNGKTMAEVGNRVYKSLKTILGAVERK